MITGTVALLVRVLFRLAAVGLPIAVAVGLVFWSGSLKSGPAPVERSAAQRPVRVLTVAPMPFIAQVSGYGAVKPAREWRAIARIEGEIVETSESLANGSFVAEGALLLRIDDTDIRLSLAQIDARSAALDVRDGTLRASRDLADREYRLAAADLDRQRGLLAQGTISQTAVEQAERAELAAQSKLTEIGNQLALNAAEREILAAERASAARSLGFSEIRAPFDVLIAEVSADLGQVVTRSQLLFAADGTDRVEIAAQVPIGRMGPLIRLAGGGEPGAALSATVVMSQLGHEVRWPAEIARISEAIDARTQSVEVIVTVDGPLAQAVPGQRPPLRRGMFVEVRLAGPEVSALVVPAAAVWGREALVVTGDGRLARRTVTVGFQAGGLAVIRDGLAAGDRLVVSDPAVAVPGMKVQPVEDEELAASIRRRALGQAGE
ncbi:efflux RND transporter periplasmic adaptor subunit [Rhodovulum euryhalinum]|uniref:RND family efflux transporter MFP subunit n=1 Tax=Rhodovulum euryhalinum TaxID=35805 RepID=A0A4R2K8V2_9RHOB|nr:efflux RND transporter periplasmic adaptor subunit [Rhodovulum euryhalinum]TCO68532.1 RND family efflux transporter MFP subunit [Rhodovulum euryhalinum]